MIIHHHHPQASTSPTATGDWAVGKRVKYASCEDGTIYTIQELMTDYTGTTRVRLTWDDMPQTVAHGVWITVSSYFRVLED